MSREAIAEFYEAVWVSAAQHGMRPAYITSDILSDLFPQTTFAANDEGASAYLRDGVNKAVKKVLSQKPADEMQGAFSEIDPAFAAYVGNLKRGSYYVESVDEFVTIPDLIKRVHLLDEARKYLRRKGEETLAEAAQLDKLYAAVVAANDNGAVGQEEAA